MYVHIYIYILYTYMKIFICIYIYICVCVYVYIIYHLLLMNFPGLRGARHHRGGDGAGKGGTVLSES